MIVEIVLFHLPGTATTEFFERVLKSSHAPWLLIRTSKLLLASLGHSYSTKLIENTRASTVYTTSLLRRHAIAQQCPILRILGKAPQGLHVAPHHNRRILGPTTLEHLMLLLGRVGSTP